MNRLEKFFASCALIGIFVLLTSPCHGAENISKTPKLDAELRYLDSLLERLHGLERQIAAFPANADRADMERANYLLGQVIAELEDRYGDTNRRSIAENLYPS